MAAKLESIHWALLRDSRCAERQYILNNVRAKLWTVEMHTLLKATGRHKNSSLDKPKLLQSILSTVGVRAVSDSVEHTASENGCKAQQSRRSFLQRSSHQAPPDPCMGAPAAHCLPIAPLLSHCSPHLRGTVPDLGGDVVSQACHTLNTSGEERPAPACCEYRYRS